LTSAPTQEELNKARRFLEDNSGSLPDSIADVLLRMLGVYGGFLQSASRAKNTLSQLREAMGLQVKSERGKTDTAGEAQVLFAFENLSPLQQEQLAAFEQKRAVARKESADYAKRIRKLKGNCAVPAQERPAWARNMGCKSPGDPDRGNPH
jgi:hypothetical protein